jgi:CO/xanthine dehydrogenase Mo-binding subunit
MRARANGTGIGQPVRRKEDFRLLTGRGRFGDDVVLPGMAHAVVVRSPHAHARIVSVNTAAALAAPGALAVLTGADYVADGLGPIPHNPGLSAPPDVQARVWVSRRSRRSISRCRRRKSAMSANRSYWSSPRPSPPPRMRRNCLRSPTSHCRR